MSLPIPLKNIDEPCIVEVAEVYKVIRANQDMTPKSLFKLLATEFPNMSMNKLQNILKELMD